MQENLKVPRRFSARQDDAGKPTADHRMAGRYVPLFFAANGRSTKNGYGNIAQPAANTVPSKHHKMLLQHKLIDAAKYDDEVKGGNQKKTGIWVKR